jgi:hypothetical protein
MPRRRDLSLGSWRGPRQVPGSRRRAGMLLILISLALVAWPICAAPADESLLEDLHFKVDVLTMRDAARARITLKSLGGGKYLAEVSGRPQGTLKALCGEREERLQTEMAWRQGRLMPLVYREESHRGGKVHLKEYRFDYVGGKLEMWQLNKGTLARKWQTKLTGPIYDPLSGFYNCRLGLLGPIHDGQVFKLQGIPYPKPENIEVRIGQETAQGRKTMISIANASYKQNPAPVFAFFDGRMVPHHAWTRVWGLGKIAGELLPGGKSLQGLTPEVAADRGPKAAPGS